jgi:anti-anti-sigma regulatory factor
VVEGDSVPVTFDRNAEPGLIRLEGEIDISQASELKRVLLEALAEKREVQVAMETVTGVDITAVQLLWAAERAAGASGQVFGLEGPVPESLCVTLHEAGFERLLFAGKPTALPEVSA